MTTTGIVLYPDAEELDIVGPWEVFTASAMLRAHTAEDSADRVVALAASLDPVRCNKGLQMLPHHTFDDHPLLDVVVVPGGVGCRPLAEDRPFLDWLAAVGGAATWATSVCTGSLLLVASGLAAGRRVATHWSFEDNLEERGDCTVVRGERWVVDGKVVSSQGVSAGIDMALWIIGQLHGPDHARLTQHYIQYDPAPPYQD